MQRGDELVAEQPVRLHQNTLRGHMGMHHVRAEIADRPLQLPVGAQKIRQIAVRLFNPVQLHPGIAQQPQEASAGATIPDGVAHACLGAGEIDRDIHMSVGFAAVIEQMHDPHGAHLSSNPEPARARGIIGAGR
jgi:hypothetical protein